MGAIQTYHLRCDNCDARFVAQPPEPRMLGELRPIAAAAGWEHRLVITPFRSGPAPSLDFCPPCVRLDAPDLHEHRIVGPVNGCACSACKDRGRRRQL